MEFQKNQKRFLNSKKTGINIIKGEVDTGKTTVALYKAVDFENNYCIYNDDKVLFISSTAEKAKRANEIYLSAKIEMQDEFYSLFSTANKERFEVKGINQFIELYSKAYMRENKLFLVYAKKSIKLRVLEKLYNQHKKENSLSRFLENVSLDYLLQEIEWIKSAAFSLNEYLEISRRGRGKNIRTNSETRKKIYDLYETYSVELNKIGYMDKYDEVLFAIKHSKKIAQKYSHIILDDCESLTRAEFKFIQSIKNNKYGNLIFIINKLSSTKENKWLDKGRNISTIAGDIKGRTFTFKNKFKNKDKVQSSIKNYEYIDMRHNKVFNFSIDTLNTLDEIILNRDDKEELLIKNELLKVPVYSKIAAGSPIEINELIEDNMNIPKEFLGTEKEVFMLQVKGDSMIDKNIEDGDFVLIKRQNSAYHNEIVAASINGSATLKTLNLNAEKPLLMPANAKYEPIKLEGKDVNILGVILGTLKNKDN